LDDGADFGVFEEHAGLGAVAVHPVDDQFFQVLVEGAGEIVAGVGGSGLLEVLVGGASSRTCCQKGSPVAVKLAPKRSLRS